MSEKGTQHRKELSNAERFIRCYNKVHSTLKEQFNMRHTSSYTEVVRRAAKTNTLVRKYEDTLVDYGRLRNAIVHSTDKKLVIAEPHLDVVQDYEKITDLITRPPLAIDTVSNSVVSTVEYDVKLKDVIEYGYKTGFSNIPIFKEGMLVGMANGQKILDVLGKRLYEKRNICEYIEKTPIHEVMKEFNNENYYTIANQRIALDEVLNMFTENRKLLAILITKNGTLLEAPIGIITTADIMDINKVLDDYRD